MTGQSNILLGPINRVDHKRKTSHKFLYLDRAESSRGKHRTNFKILIDLTPRSIDNVTPLCVILQMIYQDIFTNNFWVATRDEANGERTFLSKGSMRWKSAKTVS